MSGWTLVWLLVCACAVVIGWWFVLGFVRGWRESAAERRGDWHRYDTNHVHVRRGIYDQEQED